MISHKHKCVFVHVPKVAGISIETVFLNDLSIEYENRLPLWLGANANPEIGPPRFAHLTAEEYTKYHYLDFDAFNKYFKFSFVRNPYTRAYSFYKYLGYRYVISFENFVFNYLEKLIENENWFFKSQYDYIYDNKGNCLVDFVGKFEELQGDFDKISHIFKLKSSVIPHVNNSINHSFLKKTKYRLRLIKKHPRIIFKMKLKNKKIHKMPSHIEDEIYKIYKVDFDAFEYNK